MKRFKEDELKDYIISLTNDISRKPKIVELAFYINSKINREEYESYDQYSDHLVGEAIVQHYVNMYSLQDLVSCTKRRTKAEMKHDESACLLF